MSAPPPVAVARANLAAALFLAREADQRATDARMQRALDVASTGTVQAESERAYNAARDAATEAWAKAFKWARAVHDAVEAAKRSPS